MKFVPGNGKWYVSHLDKSFYEGQMYNSEIFTEDVLNKIEPIVNNYFKYKSLSEQEEVEREFERLNGGDDTEDDFREDVDGDDLFS